MIIEIRIVIQVPEKDKKRYPDLQPARPHSPVTVFIREMTEAVPS